MELMPTTHHPEAAELVKLSPAKGRRGFTGWKSGRTFSAASLLPASMAASASPDGLQLDPFPALDPACKAFARIIRRKQRRGYVPSGSRLAG